MMLNKLFTVPQTRRSLTVLFTSTTCALVTTSYFYSLQYRDKKPRRNPTTSPPSLQTTNPAMAQNKIKTPFETLFAVHMTCDHCVKSVSDALLSLEGITKVDANLKDQLVAVEGTAAPSAIVSAIEATGRDAILRGSGASNKPLPGAAVCILETYHRDVHGGEALVPASENSAASNREVRGLALAPGKYNASIREYGDLKFGASSTGPVWASGNGTTQPRGVLGSIEVGSDGRGAVFLDHPFQVWEVIGHAMVLSSQEEGHGELKNDENTVVGVIARSAGMWDNDKTVCSCSGKTLWEERKDEVKKGMI
ncbi:Cu,Zn superoxide dismutase-like protein [Xylariaceae sp. FL0255]|nr:Cu,Zn superoxide dismutase-like protein [Xylariaceae sp. FL0255]